MLKALSVLGLLCAAVLAAGCGGGGSPEGVASLGSTAAATGDDTTTSTAEKDPEKARIAFERCLRKNGIDVETDSNGGTQLQANGEADRKKMDKAMNACRPLMAGVVPELSEADRQKLQDAALEFAKCMREHGVDMPDPEFGNGGMMRQTLRGNPNNPKFREAQQACQSIMRDALPEGARLGGGPAGTPPGGSAPSGGSDG